MEQNELLLETLQRLRKHFVTTTDRLQMQIRKERQESKHSKQSLQWTIRQLQQENQQLRSQLELGQESKVMVLALERQLKQLQMQQKVQEDPGELNGGKEIHQEKENGAEGETEDSFSVLELLSAQHKQLKSVYTQDQHQWSVERQEMLNRIQILTSDLHNLQLKLNQHNLKPQQPPVPDKSASTLATETSKKVLQARAECRHWQEKYAHQLSTNQRIHRLIAKAMCSGIPDTPHGLTMDLPEQVVPLLQQAERELDPTDGTSVYSLRAAAVKNHIQLIDLYNHALLALAQLQTNPVRQAGEGKFDAEAFFESGEVNEPTGLSFPYELSEGEPEGDEPEENELIFKNPPMANGDLNKNVKEEIQEDFEMDTIEVEKKSAPSPSNLVISGTSSPAPGISLLRPERRLFEFGFCPDCRHHMMINL